MSDGAVTFSSIRLASTVIVVQCRSNALSKALRAVFFSVAVHVTSSSNCSIDSIDDLPLCVRGPRVEVGHGDHNPLEVPLQTEKRFSVSGQTQKADKRTSRDFAMAEKNRNRRPSPM